MTDRQEDKLKMYISIEQTCAYYAENYSHLPVMVKTVAKVGAKIVEIRQVRQQQATKTTYGVTEEKSNAFDIMVSESIKTANVVYIHAFLNNDVVLKSKVNINKSMFYGVHANEALILASNIADIAENHVDHLKEHGIDQTEINNLRNAITNFTAFIQKPKITKEEHKVLTSNLKTLFSETDSLIYDVLDKYITLFKSSAPDFYLKYKAARNH
jgi:hypothetical protein